jgi:hypothetical protein
MNDFIEVEKSTPENYFGHVILAPKFRIPRRVLSTR